MALPSSGAISWLNIATEMSQTAGDFYNIGGFAVGVGNIPPTPTGPVYAPINVNIQNQGKYPTNAPPFSPTQFYGYNATISIPADGTNGVLLMSSNSLWQCNPSSMLIFNMGTTNGSYSIAYSYLGDGSYGVEQYICFFYGPPFGSDANESTDSVNNIIYQAGGGNAEYTGSNTFIYNYVYSPSKGQYIYAVVYGNCP